MEIITEKKELGILIDSAVTASFLGLAKTLSEGEAIDVFDMLIERQVEQGFEKELAKKILDPIKEMVLDVIRDESS